MSEPLNRRRIFPALKRGSLYMLLEVSGGGHAALYRQMLNAAQTAFYEKGENVETALRQAVRSAHQVLRQANAGLPEAQWRGGASLVVRYADRVTIAQSGPGLILISHPKTVDHFPAELGIWGPALGGEERPDIQVYDITVESGSMILLAQSDWPRLLQRSRWRWRQRRLMSPWPASIWANWLASAELSALLVSFSSIIPELHDGAEPLPPVKPESADTEIEPTAAKIGIFAAAGRRLFGGRSPEEPPVAPPPEPVASPPPIAAVAAASTLPPKPAQSAPPPAPQDFADEEDEAFADEEGEEPGRSSGGRFWLILALIVIPLLIIGLVGVMLFGRARAAEQEFQQLLTGAAQAIVDAEGLADEAAITQRLSGASDFLEKARARRPDNGELAKWNQRYQALLDKVEHVTPLYGAVPLWTFEGEGHNNSRVVVSGDSLFVLDRRPKGRSTVSSAPNWGIA